MKIDDRFTPDLGECPIDCVTMVVSDDEPCFGLYEIDSRDTITGQMHRYQGIEVMRGDNKATLWVDLGLSKLWPHDPIRIPGGVKDNNGKFWIEHTVGELRDIADQIRIKPSFDKAELVGSHSGAERINRGYYQ